MVKGIWFQRLFGLLLLGLIGGMVWALGWRMASFYLLPRDEHLQGLIFLMMFLSSGSMLVVVICIDLYSNQAEGKKWTDIVRAIHSINPDFVFPEPFYDEVGKRGLRSIALELAKVSRISIRLRHRAMDDEDNPALQANERLFRVTKERFWATVVALRKTQAVSPQFPDVKKWTDCLEVNFV